MNKREEMQALSRYYKQVTGETEVDMRKIAEFAVKEMGWQLPPPVDPMETLTKRLSRAAREEIRHDKETGEPYRVNHAVARVDGTGQRVFWVDIDEAPRSFMEKSLVKRREQMVGDAVQLSLDQEHWNRIHPNEEPIQLQFDLTFDLNLRKSTKAVNFPAYEDTPEDEDDDDGFAMTVN